MGQLEDESADLEADKLRLEQESEDLDRRLVSVDEKKEDRFRIVIDEYYSFINDYPDSQNRKEADNIFKIASKHVNDK